ncbi:MAG: HU family DNA-binding protein [Clostridia bacterium]|nr:HU family DNA-binding protein [Clostridia bacterium]
MNKTELINAVAEAADVSKKDTAAVINAAIEVITKAMAKEDKVQIIGFGTFETRKRAERTSINPRTKEKVKVPASKVPAFKAGQALKNAVK